MIKRLGEVIRQKIREDGRTAKVICEELGMSRGNLDKIYHKDSLNTDLLAKLSVVLNYDFFTHVNPYRKGEVEGIRRLARFKTSVSDEAFEAANNRLQEGLIQLERAEQELEYLRASLKDAKSAHQDKDEIISLMRDKIAQQDGKISGLEAELKSRR